MFGTVLRLMAVGEAGRRLGDHIKNLVNRYLILSAAGTVFLAAIVFVILAIFWALVSWNHSPVASALIMAGVLALIGLLIALIAYGTTRQTTPSARHALQNPAHALQERLPTVEDVGRQIEYAVRRYGPVRVATAAAAGGIIAGLLAKQLRHI